MSRANRFWRWLGIVALVAAVLGTGCKPAEIVAAGAPADVVSGPRTTLLVTSEVACELSVDGTASEKLAAGATKKLEVAVGEHLVVAVTADARRFEEVVSVGSEQKVVRVRFPEARKKAVAVTPPTPKPTPPPATLPPATSPAATPPASAPSPVNEPPVAAPLPVAAPPPPAPPVSEAARVYHLRVISASIFASASNGDPNATFSEDVPPDAAFVVFVDGLQVHSSLAPLNTFEPHWNEALSFYANRSSRVQIAIYEVDLFQDSRLLARWDGTVGDLLAKKGSLGFGAISRLSYVLE